MDHGEEPFHVGRPPDSRIAVGESGGNRRRSVAACQHLLDHPERRLGGGAIAAPRLDKAGVQVCDDLPRMNGEILVQVA